MRARAFTLLEALVACGILTALAATILFPQYAAYTRAREVNDAATLLAQDIANLERFAQSSEAFEGATIEVKAESPLRYTCYSGRPRSLVPQSHLRGILFERQFPHVVLVAGALGRDSPLMFAHNGSVQYVVGQTWADQHTPVTIELHSLAEKSRKASVGLDPFTGAVSVGE